MRPTPTESIKTKAGWLLGLLVLMWGVEILDFLLPFIDLDRFGIRPRTSSGLIGVPAEEIARAVARTQPIAVALSMVYPGDDPLLPDELRRLRWLVPPGLPILIGGRAAASYVTVIEKIEALSQADLAGFKEALGRIRAQRAQSANFGVSPISAESFPTS